MFIGDKQRQMPGLLSQGVNVKIKYITRRYDWSTSVDWFHLLNPIYSMEVMIVMKMDIFFCPPVDSHSIIYKNPFSGRVQKKQRWNTYI